MGAVFCLSVSQIQWGGHTGLSEGTVPFADSEQKHICHSKEK